MNMLLHGIGSQDFEPIVVDDALAADPGDRFDLVLTNPPFGRKSSTTIVGEEGKVSKERDIVERGDFRTTTSNKQLNFVQHVKTLLKQKALPGFVWVAHKSLMTDAPPDKGQASRNGRESRCDIG